MVNGSGDQAAGLRRIFARKPLRVVSFVSGGNGVGKSAVLANLAVCLSRLRQEVLLIDENSGDDDLSAVFGMRARYDLLHVLNGDRHLEEVLVSPTPGVNILPAAKTIEKIGCLSSSQRNALMDAMQGLERPVDVLLIDAGNTHPLGFSPLGLTASETVIVLSGRETAITECYALIKKLSLAFARRNFRVLINKTRSVENAAWIQSNLVQLAAQRGLARLEAAGSIPFDDAWRTAAKMNMPVITAQPESPSALAIREFATDILHWPSAEHSSGSLGQFMEQLLRVTEKLTLMPVLTADV